MEEILMKKSIGLITVLMLSVLSVSASAGVCDKSNKEGCTINNEYNYYNTYHVIDYSKCVKEYFFTVTNSKKLSLECNQSQDLTTAIKAHYYPKLKHNPRRVRYWKGSFTRDIITNKTKKRELVDKCKGKILSSIDIKTYTDIEPVEFHINNINLDAGITESYMTTAMAEQEAKDELDIAKKACESYEIEN